MHKKSLTGENLIKRGVAGPHRCPLCYSAIETMDHFFVDCPFSQEAWKITLNGLNATTPTQTIVTTLFSSWKARYPQVVHSKSICHRIWQAIPKFLCWKICLARNEQIFNNILYSPLMVAIKEKTLLLETMTYHALKNEISLLPEEKNWLGAFITQEMKTIIARPLSTPGWCLRETGAIFQAWWRKQGKAMIFFNGACKGNPGKAGAGGVIYSSDGQRKDNFNWGLGWRTNNQAEILGLLKACQIARENGIKEIQVFGDSEILIKTINSEDHFSNPTLNKTLQRLRYVLQEFSKSHFYHILQGSNMEVDAKENMSCLLPQGTFSKNEEAPTWNSIP
jgi:ribonuclease HI